MVWLTANWFWVLIVSALIATHIAVMRAVIVREAEMKKRKMLGQVTFITRASAKH